MKVEFVVLYRTGTAEEWKWQGSVVSGYKKAWNRSKGIRKQGFPTLVMTHKKYFDTGKIVEYCPQGMKLPEHLSFQE